MRVSRKPVWGVWPVLAALAAAVYPGVSFRGVPPDMTTLMSGWEQRFSLEWTVDSPPDGRRRLKGSITSRQGGHAEPVRLLVQGRDASGTAVERRIWTVPGGVGGGQRAYFEIPDLPPAQEYRVFVWDYSLIQG